MSGKSCVCGSKLTQELDSLFTAVFGAVTLQALYAYVARSANLRREDVHNNPQVFIRSLNLIFGQGAKVLYGNLIKKSTVREIRNLEECGLWKAFRAEAKDGY